MWICNNCGGKNSGNDFVCCKCGQARPPEKENDNIAEKSVKKDRKPFAIPILLTIILVGATGVAWLLSKGILVFNNPGSLTVDQVYQNEEVVEEKKCCKLKVVLFALAGIILAAGVTSMVESVKKIIHPELPVFDLLSVIIISVAIVAKLILGRYTSSQGKKYNSEALIASGADARFDAIISASTLLGIIITLLFGITLDGWIGAVIALFILKAGFELLGESLSSILGNRPDSETTKAIKATVCEIDGVLGAYDLVLHDYGPDSALGSIHVEISSTMSAEDIHRLTKHIQLAVKDKYHVFLTVGIYAVDETHVKQREEIKRFAMEYDGVLGTHGVFIDDTMKYISFDVLTDFTVNRDQLQNDLKNHISTLLPGYKVDINFDSNYSD